MNNTKFFELMGDINDKYFAENYEEPQRVSYTVRVSEKRGAKRWIIPAAIAAAACLAVGIAAPRIADTLRSRDVIENPANGADAKTLREWLALPHNAINSTDSNVIFTPTETSDEHALLTFSSDIACDIYAVDDCTVKYTGYANAPYLGKVVMVQFDNGLWGLYRNSYKCDDHFDTEISVKAGDKLKAGDRIGSMYAEGFKLLISATEPAAELFTPTYPELDEWEKQKHTMPVPYRNPYTEEAAPEYLTENLGYRGWHSRFYFIDGSEPVYAVSNGTIYAINDCPYDENIPAKSVIIKLETGFETPLYAIYDYIASDGLTIKVGDTVKEGDAIGNASTLPASAPEGMNLTISITPEVPEMDDDGYIIVPRETIPLSVWIAQPHNAIDSSENNVVFTPTELSDDRALLTLAGGDLTDIYAVDDCTVTHVGYANAPYLGKVVSVEFDNGLWGIYRSSYKYDDEFSGVKIDVKEGDKLEAGDRIGSMYADGFKLLIGKGKEPPDILSPQYPELAKWASGLSSTDPITHREGIVYVPAENIGYHAWYTDLYVIDSSAPAYAVSDGTIVDIRGMSVIIKLDTLLSTPIYAIYENLTYDSISVSVGDTVKEGDVIGDAFTSPDGGPVTFTLTISVYPDVHAMDDDGNAIQQGQVIVD